MKKLVFLIAFLSSFFAKAQYYGVQFDSAFVAYKDSNNIFTQQNKFNLPVLIPSVPTVPFHAASKFYVDQEIINANVEEVILKGIPPTPLTLFVTKYYVDTTGADDKIYIWNGATTASGKYDLYQKPTFDPIGHNPNIFYSSDNATPNVILDFKNKTHSGEVISNNGNTVNIDVINYQIGGEYSIKIYSLDATINFALSKFTDIRSVKIHEASVFTFKGIIDGLGNSKLQFINVQEIPEYNTNTSVQPVDVARLIAPSQFRFTNPYGYKAVTVAGAVQVIPIVGGVINYGVFEPSRFNVKLANAATPNNNFDLRYGNTGLGQYTVVVGASSITVTAASGTFAVGDVLSFSFN
jgi:hypothetical protein